MTTPDPREALLRRVAGMGSCSQTHHEHIARDAAVLAQAAPPPCDLCGRTDGAHDFDCIRFAQAAPPPTHDPVEGERPRNAHDEKRLRGLGVWDETGTGR